MDINQIIADTILISSEVILLATALLALLYGLFFKEKTLHVQVILLCGMIFGAMHILPMQEAVYAFNGSIVINKATCVFRGFILLSSIITMLFMIGKDMKFEVPILMVISTFALMLMVSSNDLMTMYLTMELSALAMYICVSSSLESYSSTEAGLKYFILGSIASCIFLLGTSIVSGFSGSFSFDTIGSFIITTIDGELGDFMPIFLICGLVMIMAAFFFKVAAAPFHAWLADVYKGSSWYITVFLGSASKIAIAGLLIRCMYSLFDHLHAHMQHILAVVSVASMFIGSIAAIMQKDVKRILAYSSVGNIGFALAAMSVESVNGIASGFVYIALYSLIMFMPAFALVGLLTPQGSDSLLLKDLNAVSKAHPYKAAVLAIVMLSTAGLPPFAGFFGKFYMLVTLIAHDMPVLSILFVIAAVLSSFYSIKVIKNIYFAKAEETVSCTSWRFPLRGFSVDMVVISILCILNFIYCMYSSQVVSSFINLFSDFI